MKTTRRYNDSSKEQNIRNAYEDTKAYLTRTQWEAVRTNFLMHWARAQVPAPADVRIARIRFALVSLKFCLDFCGVSGFPRYAVARVLVDSVSTNPKFNIFS